MLENDLITWLASVTSQTVFYQHLNREPPDSFLWFIRNGDDGNDELDGSGEPDTVYFDLEAYASTPAEIQALAKILRQQRDYRGALGSGTVDDIDFQDQRDDYEPQANADTLPDYSATFRMVVTGYESA